MGRRLRRADQPKLVAAWREAMNRGIAGDLCDRIVFQRDAPIDLLVRLYEAVTNPTTAEFSKQVGDLSPAETRVMWLYASGLTTPKIAAELFLARSTVKAHLKSVFRKLDCQTAGGACVRFFALALLDAADA